MAPESVSELQADLLVLLAALEQTASPGTEI